MTTIVRPDAGAAAGSRSSRFTLPPGWPIGVALVGYPVWWALGLTTLVFPLMALPLAVQLLRRGRLPLPPGFWLWALFLLWVLVSVVALDLDADGVLPVSGTGRYFAFASRFVNYLSVTVLLLYVGTLPERVLPRMRVLHWMLGLCIGTVVLGLLAVALPGLEFQNPLARLLPAALVEDAGGAVRQLAQSQPVLGYTAPRPSAPFAYTNAWGNNLSLLLIWGVLATWVVGGRRRIASVVLLGASVIPIVYSLNRGMWIGLGIAVLYVAVRLALRGRINVLIGLVLALGVAAAVFLATPLNSMVSARIDSGHSNDVRSSLASDSLRLAQQSPVIGFGSTRSTQGSDSSIAVGKSPDCPRCGNRVIGSTGQLWLVLVAQGFVGAALYLGYLLRTAWAFRRDHSPVGIAGSLVVLLTLFYSFFYTALTMPLAIAFISIALMWRNQQEREAAADAAAPDVRGRAPA